MEIVDTVENTMAKLLRDKEARRGKLARLSFEEKVRIVVELQKIQEPILRARGIDVKVWDLSDELS